MVKIHHIQPALPSYRIDFFDRLAMRYGSTMLVHYTDVDMGALTKGNRPRWARPLGDFWYLPFGLSWQSSALAVPMERGDIVIISGAPRCLSNLVLLLKVRWKGAQAVWWGHYWSSTSKRWRHMLRVLLMRASDALLFYTDQEVVEYQSTNRDRRPIAALNNGIDTTPIRLARKPYVAADRDDALLFIGRVTAKARLDLALSALAGVPNVALHIIGSGPVERDLIDQASALGLAERVHWHGGMTDEAQIAAIAARCRAFLYPGPVGLSLIHAMAHGLPTLVHSDRWSNGPEIAAFEDGVTGQAFPPGDAEAMASTIRAALSNLERLDAWSEKVIARTEAGYNTEDMARRFIALIDRLE